MMEKRSNVQGRSELGVIAFYMGAAAALVVALLSDGTVRTVALVVLALLVVYFLVGDFFLAMSDERAIRRNPHDHRVSDVGRRVRVIEDFTRRNGYSSGRVSMSGETWKARSRDRTLHKAGEELVVVNVDRLVLVVAPKRRE